MINVNIKEVYRYLGYHQRTQTFDICAIDELIHDCIDDLQKVALPKYSYKKYPLTLFDHGVKIGDMIIESNDLRRNLDQCDAAYVLAATIGIGVDRMIQRANYTDVTKAVIYQAIGAAMVEQVVDDLNEEICQIETNQHRFLRPRYSPGYGDCDLHYQVPVLQLFTNDQLGITLMDSYLMVPSKSITAFIGVSSIKRNHHQSSCDTCTQVNCAMRREDV